MVYVICLLGMTATATLAFLCAFTCMRTANACYAAFFFFSYVEYGTSYDNQKDCYNNNICQTITPSNEFLLLFNTFYFNAYSEARFSWFFFVMTTITATIAITAIRPGTKPLPSVPSVIRVPIWYTKNATV